MENVLNQDTPATIFWHSSIVNKVEGLFVSILLGFQFWPDREQRSFCRNLLNNRNMALTYSVTILEQKKDCARSGSFQHKLQ